MRSSERRDKSRVSLVRVQDRKDGVQRVIEVLGHNPVRGKEVMLKPNFNTADPYPGSTHIDTLRELILHLWDMGAEKITIGERSGPPNTEEVMTQMGIFELAEELGVEVMNFDELSQDQLVKVDPPGSHWEDGFAVPRALQEAECVVSTPCLKTHQFGGIFTMALKLAVGIVPKENTTYMRQMHNSENMRKMIAELNVGYSPDLIVLDGMEAFVDGGPMEGTRKRANVFLAATDRIAIDAVGLAVLKDLGTTDEIMSRGIFEQQQIQRAVELGLGVSRPEDIEIVTDESSESEACADKIQNILSAG